MVNKKAYITPAVQVVNIATGNIMITGSVVYDKQAESGSEGFSRRGGFWDEED